MELVRGLLFCLSSSTTTTTATSCSSRSTHTTHASQQEEETTCGFFFPLVSCTLFPHMVLALTVLLSHACFACFTRVAHGSFTSSRFLFRHSHRTTEAHWYNAHLCTKSILKPVLATRLLWDMLSILIRENNDLNTKEQRTKAEQLLKTESLFLSEYAFCVVLVRYA